MQGISAVAWRRVHVGVGLNDCSIVSSDSMGETQRHAFKAESLCPIPASIERRPAAGRLRADGDSDASVHRVRSRGENGRSSTERSRGDSVDLPAKEVKGMRRVKHPPVRNKINLKDPAQVRVWNRRLGVTADELKATVDKVGNSIATVTKEVELQQRETVPPVADPGPADDVELRAPA